MDTLNRHHRSFQYTKWALQDDDLKQLEAIASKFQPEDVIAKNRYLFDEQMPDVLGEKRSGDISAYDAAVGESRISALCQIEAAEGLAGIHRLVDSTKEAFLVGWTVGASGVNIAENDVLADLDSENPQRLNFALGFVRQRFTSSGLPWVDTIIPALSKRPVAQARVLRLATAGPDVWERARKLGTEVESSYWKEFLPIGLGSDFGFVNEVAQHLLDHGRPGTATDMLAMYADRTDPPARPELIADVLDALVAVPPEQQRVVSSYELQRLLEFLRASNLDEVRLAGLEWQLLPGLGYGVPAPTLERRLARDPEFFVQLLSMCFKRADGTSEGESNPDLVHNAYRLLHEWHVVPGSSEPGGRVDEAKLNDWLHRTLELLAEADRTVIGQHYIGHIFAHAKEDGDGTWPTQPVRDAIERLAKDEVESGFGTQIFNNRGVTNRGLTEGGRQERDLARRFENWESLIRDRWPRTAAVLRSVAESYRAQAQGEDEEAERFKKGLDPFG